MSGRDERLDVAEVLYRYAKGIDRRDWALYRSLFTDTIDSDFSSYRGAAQLGIPADDWVAGVRVLMTGLVASQHHMGSPLVDIDGDEARCTMELQAEHVLDHDDPTAWFTIAGWYDDRLVRVDGGWKLRSVTLNVTWTRGRPEVLDLARRRGRELLAPG